MASVASSSKSPPPPPHDSTPEPPRLTKPKAKKKSKKDKGKEGHGKNEGSSANAAYQPPPNAIQLNHESVDYGEFDWDAVESNGNCELWLLRIPDSIKPKYLENLSIELPQTTKHSTKVGVLERKLANYDIWAIGEGEDADANSPVVGEEIRNLSCLLPRKSKEGKLFSAPKPIARRLVFSAQPATPTSNTPSAPILFQNPPRHSYPKESLKHRFMPFGSQVISDVTPADINSPGDEEAMEVDAVLVPEQPTSGQKSDKDAPATASQPAKEKSKTKKRKVEESSPKKVKKVKKS
ncbi:hypothetical protein PLEOSDRAFT_1110847 [Pleurotus ostreatus PC15]|uniref:Uncharacterized protein n=1 Tax=Pleurotus ostreatus (strain PC15) TaxID=1137138 RepID=A0A067P1R3_PLEO1|nr:hypothetical protein PLEOSDRAFT_1110847 [Pleurotus ostreatus PC15]